MDQAQPTLADLLAHPMFLTIIGVMLAIIGWLLCYLVSRKDKRMDQIEARLHYLDMAYAAMTGKKPSDVFKNRREDSSA